MYLLPHMSMSCQDFNPRTREGCDAGIHRRNVDPDNFNPRTREGCDLVLRMTSVYGWTLFQSTHP